MNFMLIMLLLFALIQFSYNSCIDINTDVITNFLNITYDKDCFDYTIQNNKDCCSNFLIDDECTNMYTHCIDYSDYVIDNLHHICQYHNQTISNISYSDYCHKFILNIEPYCCENMTKCVNWYTNCAHNFTNPIVNCTTPTKYTSETCTNYTLNIDSNCCDYFNDHCNQIYDYCIQNSPESVSVFDLFLPPQVGFIIGTTLTTYTNIPDLTTCLQMCISNVACLSTNYNDNLQYCHLTRHVVGDHISKNLIHLNEDKNYIYYEKKLTMPHIDTYCNVRFPTYLGDSVCDTTGGYNTEECYYDGGDCCRQSCLQNNFNLLCGLGGYTCIDPKYDPTLTPTHTPTHLITKVPTYSPTYSPTHTPTYSPTHTPTYSPTHTPTYTPTFSPTHTPTNSPTYSPTIIISSTSTNNSEDAKGVITVLTIFLVLTILLFVGYVIRDTYYTRNVQLYPKSSESVHFHNPVYDKNHVDNNNIEEESGVYDDIEIENIDYEDETNYQVGSHEENNFMN